MGAATAQPHPANPAASRDASRDPGTPAARSSRGIVTTTDYTTTTDCQIGPIGYVESPLGDLATAPKQGREGAPDAWLVFNPDMAEGIRDFTVGSDALILTWLHQAQRDVLAVHPQDNPRNPETGVFSTRSADRPNPIGLHRVRIAAIDGLRVLVHDLEAIDRTPILDVKPILSGQGER
jgi:tRNA-Thr(GGU) m(6)t(6)A37 methyltransferase TsaA